ncbi:MAG: sigma-70 family RNA polymerase sigma factor [Planctomycetaceae bacterium]|nr:sigma-70 family RNA polymerase sigma factor [Planctomycetaceae bacterium]
MPANPAQLDLVRRIREGSQSAWRECIDRYEGRLVAFAQRRLRDKSMAEDIVQETFIGFLNSLPNYDEQTPIDSFLFAIAAHKLTDHLRKVGRRPQLNRLSSAGSSTPGLSEPPGSARRASSLIRSHENWLIHEAFLAETIGELVQQWCQQGDYERLKCTELLFVREIPNKDAAAQLGISEQAVANHKHYVVGKLKDAIKTAQIIDADLQGLGLN